MKHLLLTTIAAAGLVGCGESQQSAPPAEVKPAEPVAEVPAQPSPPPVEAKPVKPVAEVATPEPPTAKAPDISIWNAAEKGNIEAVKQHLASGADVNVKDTNRWTPLHYAVYYGHKKVIELLIAKGADVKAKDMKGRTPLHEAAASGHKEIVEVLIANGAKHDSGGSTPLDCAVQGGHKEIIELLITAGADVNARDVGEWGPLHMAVKLGHTGFGPRSPAKIIASQEIAELLIAAGADVNAEIEIAGATGQTPIDLADLHARTDIAELLRKHGGKTGLKRHWWIPERK